MAKRWKKYLLWFAQEHVDFRIAVSDKFFDYPVITNQKYLQITIKLYLNV